MVYQCYPSVSTGMSGISIVQVVVSVVVISIVGNEVGVDEVEVSSFLLI